MSKTKIEWTNGGATWNPVVGCSPAKGSEQGGCRECYATGQVHRFGERYRNARGLIRLGRSKRDALTFLPTDGDGKTLGKGAKWTGEVWLMPEVLAVPLRRRKPTTYFVNSLSDLFHESIVDSEEGRRFIAAIFGVMAATPQHTYQVLTKRPNQACKWFSWLESNFDGLSPSLGPTRMRSAAALNEVVDAMTVDGDAPMALQALTSENGLVKRWPLPNVWLGVSVENQATADERIPWLAMLPASVRWLSCEPLLGPMDLHGAGAIWPKSGGSKVDWVVIGGESGPRARPGDVDQMRRLLQQCQEAGVPVFMKQLGSRPMLDYDIKDAKGGDPNEWPEDLRVREYPEAKS